MKTPRVETELGCRPSVMHFGGHPREAIPQQDLGPVLRPKTRDASHVRVGDARRKRWLRDAAGEPSGSEEAARSVLHDSLFTAKPPRVAKLPDAIGLTRGGLCGPVEGHCQSEGLAKASPVRDRNTLSARGSWKAVRRRVGNEAQDRRRDGRWTRARAGVNAGPCALGSRGPESRSLGVLGGKRPPSSRAVLDHLRALVSRVALGGSLPLPLQVLNGSRADSRRRACQSRRPGSSRSRSWRRRRPRSP